MALSRQPRSFGFPFPAALLLLLAPDPGQSFFHGATDRIFIEAERRGNPKASVGRTYPEVQVPYALPVDLRLDIGYAYAVYSFPGDRFPAF